MLITYAGELRDVRLFHTRPVPSLIATELGPDEDWIPVSDPNVWIIDGDADDLMLAVAAQRRLAGYMHTQHAVTRCRREEARLRALALAAADREFE